MYFDNRISLHFIFDLVDQNKSSQLKDGYNHIMKNMPNCMLLNKYNLTNHLEIYFSVFATLCKNDSSSEVSNYINKVSFGRKEYKMMTQTLDILENQ